MTVWATTRRALAMAWRSLIRQPARASLGILGVAAVGALLLDMLLLSEGLIVSMRDLLARTGYDVRVTATEDLPRNGPRLRDVQATLSAITRLPQVRGALAVRFADAAVELPREATLDASLEGATGNAPHPWHILRGRDVREAGEAVINESIATASGAGPGATLMLRADCGAGTEALPPARLQVVGVAEFPFALTNENTIGATLGTVTAACGSENADQADVILVTSADDPDAAVVAIKRARSDLGAATNEQVLGRIQRTGFTYFQQISSVLTTITVSFALLLIAVLLTVSVNQRLGEIAALRALGFSRGRVVADVLCESALIVAMGGALSLPIGAALATVLDRILKRMPGIPAELHFFVFQPTALELHIALLAATAVLAALYPMHIVARLPIAATLRDQVAE
jgi:ABC-type lipoprotein release transport system permease subunit